MSAISTTRAVIRHKTTVSQKTSKIPRHPWECASRLDDACAIVAVPQPASFDKRPLVKPYRMALEIPKPTPPLTALFIENASLKILVIATHRPSKLEKIINNKNKNETVVFIGDGINDTPALKLADVGIAMGGIGADSAKEASDIVIMNDDISKIISSIKISKFTHKIVIQNIVIALVVKVLAMIIGGFDLLGSWGMYIAVVSDVGVCLITILNTLRILVKKIRQNY